jgi:hypothetical protein
VFTLDGGWVWGEAPRNLTYTAVPPFHDTVLDLTTLLIAKRVIFRGGFMGGDLLLGQLISHDVGVVVDGESLRIPGSGSHGEMKKGAERRGGCKLSSGKKIEALH